MPVAIIVHILSAILWVGGMFFAYQILRPVAADQLEPAQRLPLWAGAFARFFPWVWGFALLLPVSGYWIAFRMFGGMANFPLYIHLMQGLGILMVLLFFHLFFAPYRRFKQALDAGDLPEAGNRLNQIRIVIHINLILGIVISVIASGGRFGLV